MKTIRQFLLVLGLLALVAQSGFAHPDTFKPAFTDSLVSPYLKVQTALAADDLPVAKAAASELLAAAAKGPDFKAFTAPAKAIAMAPDIAAARASFLTVSKEMISLVAHVGTTGGQDLYVAHCPMAFGNKGGDWLQADEKINNPYYGASMLRCGSIKSQAAAKSAADGGHDAHH